MAWIDWHRKSEDLAAKASVHLRNGMPSRAQESYSEAAEAEVRALAELDRTKTRTLGITVVSAVSLWYKAKAYARAEELIHRALAEYSLPPFASEELKLLLQSVWLDSAQDASGVPFLPGKIMVSVKGAEIIPGAAPLGLIVEKIQTMEKLFYRTVEQVKGLPHRRRGDAPKDIKDLFSPWLFQAAPGSYQFALAIREPSQMLIPGIREDSERIAAKFFQIVGTSSGEHPDKILDIVGDSGYASTFLRLTRSLAPSGEIAQSVEISSVSQERPIVLGQETRRRISQSLKTLVPAAGIGVKEEPTDILGVLRGVQLDDDWIEVVTDDNETIRVVEARDTVDDVIGPMVNKRVLVKVMQSEEKARYLDIELVE